MERFPEQTTRQVTFHFRDQLNVLTVPLTVLYRIDDEDSGAQILDWTTVTPASEVTVSVTASQNEIRNANNLKERRIITVKSTDTEGTKSDQYVYEIFKLSGLH